MKEFTAFTTKVKIRTRISRVQSLNFPVLLLILNLKFQLYLITSFPVCKIPVHQQGIAVTIINMETLAVLRTSQPITGNLYQFAHQICHEHKLLMQEQMHCKCHQIRAHLTILSQ